MILILIIIIPATVKSATPPIYYSCLDPKNREPQNHKSFLLGVHFIQTVDTSHAGAYVTNMGTSNVIPMPFAPPARRADGALREILENNGVSHNGLVGMLAEIAQRGEVVKRTVKNGVETVEVTESDSIRLAAIDKLMKLADRAEGKSTRRASIIYEED